LRGVDGGWIGACADRARGLTTVLTIAAALFLALTGPASATGEVPPERNANVLDLQDQLLPVADEITKKLGDDLGGIWLDYDDQEPLKIGAPTDIADPVKSRLEELISTSGVAEMVQIVTVDDTLAELEAAQDEIDERLHQARDKTPDPNAPASLTYIDTARNRAVVVFGDDIDAQGRAVVEADADEAPADVMIAAEAATNPIYGTACGPDPYWEEGKFNFCNRPLRAGPFIYNHAASGGVGGCTAGFMLRQNGTGAIWALTAGHCRTMWLAQGSTGIYTEGYPGLLEYGIGQAAMGTWGWGGDFAFVSVTNPFWYVGPYVFQDSTWLTPREELHLTNVVGSTYYGMWMCHSGGVKIPGKNWSDCGGVEAVNVTATYSTTYGYASVSGLARSNVCSIEGDSGGPVWATNRALGIIVAGDFATPPCVTYFQPIQTPLSWGNMSLYN